MILLQQRSSDNIKLWTKFHEKLIPLTNVIYHLREVLGASSYKMAECYVHRFKTPD